MRGRAACKSNIRGEVCVGVRIKTNLRTHHRNNDKNKLTTAMVTIAGNDYVMPPPPPPIKIEMRELFLNAVCERRHPEDAIKGELLTCY